MREGCKATRLRGSEARDRLPLRAVVPLVVCLLVACTRPAAPAGDADASTHRIISLVPAVTEMLFAIGAGDDVVGVSSFDSFPPEVKDLPRVGALVDPDFERILTLRPTLVVVYGSQNELVERLERASIPYFRYSHAVQDGLSDVTNTMRALGAQIGRTETAAAAADQIDRELADVRARLGGRHRPTTALVFGREPGTLRGIYVSGGVGFLHDLLVAAGGRNVFEDVPRENLQASVEMLLQRAPEVIIELRSSSDQPPAAREVERAAWNRLAALPAVRNGRIYVLADESLSIPGPRIASAARTFFDVLHDDDK